MEPDSAVFDHMSALASVGGDIEFLSEIAGLVSAAWPTLLSDLRKDVAAGNFSALDADARLAQTAAEYVGAGRAHMAALHLQMMAVHNDQFGASQAVKNLEGEVAKLQAALSALRTPWGSPPGEASLSSLPVKPRPVAEDRLPLSNSRCSGARKGKDRTEPVDDFPKLVEGWLDQFLSWLGSVGFTFGVSRR